jgi:demethylmenaquinone methyltransferase / 2-methoxy-6-polyprenyl-1,4-benzoquinol methylase
MSQPPLPVRSKYWLTRDDRQSAVNRLFDRAAEHYDRACDVMSFGSGQAYRRAALERAGLRESMTVLDVGTGTGLLAREISRLVGSSGRVIGVDPSARMLAAGGDHLHGRCIQGLGERLPFASARFDVVTMGYALRHVPDLDQAFSEYARVLKPNGRLLLLEITLPSSALGTLLARAYFGGIVPLLSRVATGSADTARLMRFYWDTIAHCVPPETILGCLARNGFAATRAVNNGIFSEYVATKAPGVIFRNT